MELKDKIKKAGLLKNAVAEKLGISAPHFSMMLNGGATMPEEIRNKVNSIINQAMKITV